MSTAVRHLHVPRQHNPRRLAEESLESADGDWKVATELMFRDAKNDQAMIEKLALEACNLHIQYAARRHRSQICRNRQLPPQLSQHRRKGMELLAQERYHEWLEYPLRGGKKLAYGTREDFFETAQYHGTLERANGEKKRFFELVGAQLRGSEMAIDRFDEAALSRLYEEARHVE